MQVPDNVAGKTVKCPSCTRPFMVPAMAPAGAAAGTGAGARPPSSPDMRVPPKPAPPPPKPAAGPSKCPACGSVLNEGAVACMDCGFLITAEGSTTEDEAPPLICANPQCGVANPPTERNCQRCSQPLPMAGGTVLHGRYKLEKLLAQGGFGAVYLGVDTKGGNRQVAVKDMILGEDPKEFNIRLNFFRREFEILRSLEAVPIVPRVYDFIHQGQTAHLVMEFIRGKDLMKIMEANGNRAFPMPQVIDWGKHICDVLDHMHSQQPPLVHRDLKPENVMLLEDQRSIKMIDFGTARDLGKNARERAAKKTLVFSAGYAPPEQRIGIVEPRSDLYALAATLFHLATGKHPDDCDPPMPDQVEDALKTPTLPEHKQYRWFYELLKINLAEDINERYFTAKEFKADLERQRISTEMNCPQCQTPNKVRTPYCVKCAHCLTNMSLICSSCGKNNAMGSRFCIYDGSRLK